MLDYSASSIDESGVWRQMCGGSAAQGAVVLCCLPAVIHHAFITCHSVLVEPS